ncbi:MAG: branched-chain amino acid transaminase [bacterium]
MTSTALESVIVYFENKFVPLRDARVGILTHALHYGTGVFEGIRGYWDDENDELFLMRPFDHYARWIANGQILRIAVPHTPAQLCDLTLELIRRNNFHENLYIRPLAYKSAQRIKVHPDDANAFAIVALPFGEYLNSENGIHAGVVSWRRIEDDAIPGRAKICGAYVNSVLAGDEARRNGFDEAIFLTESGHVAEGAACNIFLVRDKKLITPAVTENILEGITRASVMEMAARELKLEVLERRVDRSELYMCDELFFTGTAVEIAPVTRVDHRTIGSGQVGAITRELRRLYVEATRGRLAAYRHWAMPAHRASAAATAG